jgi:hypothetical protein
MKKAFALTAVLSLAAFAFATGTPKASADIEGLTFSVSNSAQVTNSVSVVAATGASDAHGGNGGTGGMGGSVNSADDDDNVAGAGGMAGHGGDAIITTGNASASGWVYNTVNANRLTIGGTDDIEDSSVTVGNSAGLTNALSVRALTGRSDAHGGNGGTGGMGGSVNSADDDMNTAGAGGDAGHGGAAVLTTGNATSEGVIDNTVNDTDVDVSAMSDDIEDSSFTVSNSLGLTNAIDVAARTGRSTARGGHAGTGGDGGSVNGGDESNTAGAGGAVGNGGRGDIWTGNSDVSGGVVNVFNRNVVRIQS